MLSPKRETIGGGGNVAALELAANDDMPCRVNSVDLKNQLCDVETDCRDLCMISSSESWGP